MYWYFDAWKRYAQFSGTATREAFWVFVLVNCIVTIVFVLMEILYPLSWKVDVIYSVLIFLPMLALTSRRLHDIGRSAWWLLIVLVPVGVLVLFILLALPSANARNANSGSTKIISTIKQG